MVKKTLGYNFQFPVTYKYQNTFHGLLTSFCRNQANGNKNFKNLKIVSPELMFFRFCLWPHFFFLSWYYEMEIQLQKKIIIFEKRNNI